MKDSVTAPTAATSAKSGDFRIWVEYFETNPARQQRIESGWDVAAEVRLTVRQRRALVRSFQRFELGESGDGARLLKKARAAGDAVYTAALELLVAEEQKHSALFGLGLRRMGAPSLRAHWSDAAFTRLRRMFGLRTEIALFLVAEAVAVEYFEALATHAPDPILRGIGERIRTDEREHLRFQIDRLRVGFAGSAVPVRALLKVAWTVISAGAAIVLVVDHAAALRVCGRSPLSYGIRAVRRFWSCAGLALDADGIGDGLLGPALGSAGLADAPTDARRRR